MANQWYDNSSPSDSDWYASGMPASVPEPSRKSRKGWLVFFGCVLGVVALIVGSALLFRTSGSPAAQEDGGAVTPEENAPGFAENFRDYFKDFYSSWEAKEACTIPRAESYTDFSIRLSAPGEEELTLQQIYAKCVPSVVAVTAFIDETRNDRYYWGTGIILSEDGYIVTNAHVIEGSCRAKVTLWDDREYEVLLVGYDSRSDVAILKVNTHGLTPAEFSSTETLAVGDRVVAIGNPLGTEFRSTMTEGIISGIDRDVSYNGTSLTLLQTSTPINEGNSGGPLINMYGQVVGITNMKMSNRAGDVTIEGVGFAIPSRIVKTMADSLLSRGEVLGRPALGLTLGSIPDEARDHYELPQGLYISDVAEGSDCLTQGIRPGDVLTAVNGNEVTETSEVSRILADMSVGDTLELTVWRKEENEADPATFTVQVRLVDVNDVY